MMGTPRSDTSSWPLLEILTMTRTPTNYSRTSPTMSVRQTPLKLRRALTFTDVEVEHYLSSEDDRLSEPKGVEAWDIDEPWDMQFLSSSSIFQVDYVAMWPTQISRTRRRFSCITYSTTSGLFTTPSHSWIIFAARMFLSRTSQAYIMEHLLKFCIIQEPRQRLLKFCPIYAYMLSHFTIG